jgi:predicted nucleic acid-binding protein
MIVIADSGPVRHLIVIEQIHLLPALYGRILFPPGVANELTQAVLQSRFAFG